MSYFLKFGSADNIKKLHEKGEVFMNTFQFFKDLERIGTGDIYEGTTHIRNFSNGTLTIELEKGPLKLTNAKVHLREHYQSHIGNMLCLYHISDKLFKRKNTHRFDKRLMSFGDSCLLIKNANEFLTRVIMKLGEMEIETDHCSVKYKNFKHYKDLKVGLFHKTHKLSYQHEYRIIAYTQENRPLKFEIGNLKEIADIYPTRVVIEKMKATLV